MRGAGLGIEQFMDVYAIITGVAIVRDGGRGQPRIELEGQKTASARAQAHARASERASAASEEVREARQLEREVGMQAGSMLKKHHSTSTFKSSETKFLRLAENCGSITCVILRTTRSGYTRSTLQHILLYNSSTLACLCSMSVRAASCTIIHFSPHLGQKSVGSRRFEIEIAVRWTLLRCHPC